MAAVKLAFTTQPVGYTSEGVLLTQPVVTAQNGDNSTDTSFTGIVTLLPDQASTRFYTPTPPLIATHTVQPGSTASTLIVSPALSFPASLPPTYDGQGYIVYVKTVLGSPWSAATAYNPGDYVTTFDGVHTRSYRCILANTNQTPPNATYWTLDATTYQRVPIAGNTGTNQLDLVSALSAAPSAGVTVEVHSTCIPAGVAATCVNGVATFSGLSLFGWEPTALVASSPGLTSATSNALTPTGARDGPAELPRVLPVTAAPTINGVVKYVGPTGDYPGTAAGLQQAIDDRVNANSALVDAIILQHGVSIAGNFILKKKLTQDGVIVIKEEIDHTPENSRVQMSTFVGGGYARLSAPVGGAPVFACDPGAHHFRLQGFEVTTASLSNGLINFTDRVSEANYTGLLADMPHHLICDRLYVHDDGTSNVKYGVKLNCGEAGVVDCYIGPIIDRNNDCQAICDFAGAGPYRIHNNHCEAPSENLIFGGADPYVLGAVSSDVTITRNYFVKPIAWLSNPTITAKVKNLFELKSVRRCLVEGNVMENNWAGGQSGSAFLLTPVNQQAGAPTAGVRDVTVRKNVLRNSSSGFNFVEDNSELGVPSVGLWRVAMHDNATWNICDPLYVPSDNRLLSLLDGCYDVWITHNHFLGTVNASSTKTLIFDEPTRPARRSKYSNNLSTAESYAFIASGDTPGGPSINHCLLDAGGEMNNNALIHFDPVFGGTGYPASTLFPATNAAVGFASLGITATWDSAPIEDVLPALAITNVGTPDLRSAASDGRPVGADMTAVLAATSGVVDGQPASAGPLSYVPLVF